MTKQLTRFFFFKKENISNLVRDVLKSVVDQVVTKEPNEAQLTNYYQMTAEKLQLLPKDEAFECVDKNAKKSVSWVEMDA